MIDQQTPFSQLTPDFVLDAVESIGVLTDARIVTLNSYENRVYQVGIEDGEPIIAKFYRPNRWREEQILEEHDFSFALEEADVPVVAPLKIQGETLFHYQGYRFSLFPRRGGRAPELDDDDTLYVMGQYMGRLHSVALAQPFTQRPTLDVQSFGIESREYLLAQNCVPASMREAYESVTEQLLDKVAARLQQVSADMIRLHGDCHPGNILWRDDKPNFVDLDDARMGPRVQDVWMLLSGEPERQRVQLSNFIEGYDMFNSFPLKELALIESLRVLRQMHYAAWLARRWNDPAFPLHFPWFASDHYWAQHITGLREQLYMLDQPSLQLY